MCHIIIVVIILLFCYLCDVMIS